MDKKRRNYKLIFDPFLHRGQHQKVYRFDGINPVVRTPGYSSLSMIMKGFPDLYSVEMSLCSQAGECYTGITNGDLLYLSSDSVFYLSHTHTDAKI